MPSEDTPKRPDGATPAERAALAILELVDRLGIEQATAALVCLAATIDAERLDHCPHVEPEGASRLAREKPGEASS